jgi:LacI family transcriptional regulator
MQIFHAFLPDNCLMHACQACIRQSHHVTVTFKLQRGRFDKMATSEQVARLAGVSRATVSRTLNGSARVSEETRKRIYAAVATLGYKTNRIARPQNHPDLRTIALAPFYEKQSLSFSGLAQTSHYFYLSVLGYIERLVAEAHFDFFLPAGGNQPLATVHDTQTHYIQTLQAHDVAGVIAISVATTAPLIQALLHSSIPIVFFDSMFQGPRATWVKSDYMDGARQAVEHLLKLGHRRIAFFHGDDALVTNAERVVGWQHALASSGLTMDPHLLRLCGWESRDAYQAAMAFLNEHHDFTAIAAGSDMMAFGIMRALRQHGLRVPEDISLIGFDDIDFCEDNDPPLTTIRQDSQTLSQGIVSRLVQFIEGQETPTPLTVPTQLIVRASTRHI